MTIWFDFDLDRHQIQHYTNQLAKDTNKSLKELAHIPGSTVASEQVPLLLAVHYSLP